MIGMRRSTGNGNHSTGIIGIIGITGITSGVTGIIDSGKWKNMERGAPFAMSVNVIYE